MVSRVMDSIPGKLLDKELGMQPSPVQEVPVEAGQAKQDGQPTADQQPKQDAQREPLAGNDGDFEEEEEGRLRLPLFTNKVMVLVQDLLQYKVGYQPVAHTPKSRIRLS